MIKMIVINFLNKISNKLKILFIFLLMIKIKMIVISPLNKNVVINHLNKISSKILNFPIIILNIKMFMIYHQNKVNKKLKILLL